MMASVALGQAVANVPTCFSSLKNVDSLPGCLRQSFMVAGGEGGLMRPVPRRGEKLRRVSGVRNALPEVAEMEPASKGSQLLGEVFLAFPATCYYIYRHALAALWLGSFCRLEASSGISFTAREVRIGLGSNPLFVRKSSLKSCRIGLSLLLSSSLS